MGRRVVTTTRSARVADQIRRVLADLLRVAGDPRLGPVTVTDVRLSPDLKHAVVFVTTLDDAERDRTLHVLARAAPFLRRSLARRAGLRFTPELRFVFDEALLEGMRVEEILGELHRHDVAETSEASEDEA
jgi:ribosome-binding factor A